MSPAGEHLAWRCAAPTHRIEDDSVFAGIRDCHERADELREELAAIVMQVVRAVAKPARCVKVIARGRPRDARLSELQHFLGGGLKNVVANALPVGELPSERLCWDCCV